MKNISISILLVVVFAAISFAQDSPLKILESPKPELPKSYATLDAQGSVILKVDFLASGKIGNIVTIAKMPLANLNKLAVEAARRIKFEPMQKGGLAVDSSKLISYRYSWMFSGWKPIDKDEVFPKSHLENDPVAEAIIAKVVTVLGGDKYLNVTSQIGRGKFSVVREGAVLSFQSFTDIIVFPDKERTDFKGGGSRTTQTNVGDKGWIFDGDKEAVTEQTEEQIANFKRGMRASLDTLLRGHWRGNATLSYAGKRPATLGKRNHVLKLTYTDGLIVEFEIGADDSIPAKAIQRRKSAEGEETVEEDRYAQFVDIDGIKSPFIIDRFNGGAQTSRINYQSVEYNKRIPDSIFVKPSNPKELKKDLKL